MDGLPLITVITLSYHSPHLREAVASVLAQTYPRIQYLIADDGTRPFDADALRQQIATLNRGNVVDWRVRTRETNLGTVANYNLALREAEGIYIFPLSADDVFADERVLEEWVRYFERTGDDVICAYCANVDEATLAPLGRWPRPDQARLLLSRRWDRIYRAMEREKLLPGATMARTRKSLETLGYFDESYRLLEDYPFQMRLLRQGTPIGFWPRCAVLRRTGGVSDRHAPHPQLTQDMERFYNVDVYPFCRDPQALRRHFRRRGARAARIDAFGSAWAGAGPGRRLLLALRMPGQALRRAYHALFKI